MQLSEAVRNSMLDGIEPGVGTAPVIRFRTGAPPASCTAADSGTVLAEFTLASDWMAPASGGSKAFSGVPITDPEANAAGTLGHYRVYDSAGTACHMQGTITATAGGGDLTVSNTSVAAGQQIDITGWTFNMDAFA